MVPADEFSQRFSVISKEMQQQISKIIEGGVEA
jgi:hypothetical protein